MREIVTLWDALSSYQLSSNLEKMVPAGHTGSLATHGEPELDAFLDLLVLVFDTTVLPEEWKDIGGQQATERMLTYYDEGALLPLDRKGRPRTVPRYAYPSQIGSA